MSIIFTQLDSWVNRPMVSEMFRIVGYHIPQNAVCSPDRFLYFKLDQNMYLWNQGRTLLVRNWTSQTRPPTGSHLTQCITAQSGQPIRRRHHMTGTTLTEDLISTGINRYKSFGCRIAQIMIYEPTFWTFCSIIEDLNGSDIRILVKYLEERSQMVSILTLYFLLTFIQNIEQ